ncbi:MAG: phosphoribosylglycinamide formyltransferase [Rhizomicrobium sp.]
MSRVRVAVLISGRGSNLQALIDAAKAPDYPAEIALVVSNKENAAGLCVAQNAGIPTRVIPHQDYENREDFDRAIDAALRAARIDLIAEAGFMRIHSEWFAKTWEGKALNIHPSLLPLFPGIRVHQQALDAGATESGCTVHFIVAALDSGPTIAQAAVPVLPGDTVETLAGRILVEEHRIYPEALKLVAQGKVKLEGGRAVFA